MPSLQRFRRFFRRFLAALPLAAALTACLTACISPSATDALVEAVRRNDADAFGKAIARGAKPDLLCRDAKAGAATGDSPCGLLAQAARNASEELIGQWIRSGASLDGAGPGGATALAVALRDGRKTLARMLMEAGADTNHPDDAGITPFMLVCASGDAALAEDFIAHGAQVDAAFPDHTNAAGGKVTALMLAARAGQRRVVDLLLHHGASVTAQDGAYRTAADYARDAGYEETVAMIAGHGRAHGDGQAVAALPVALGH